MLKTILTTVKPNIKAGLLSRFKANFKKNCLIKLLVKSCQNLLWYLQMKLPSIALNNLVCLLKEKSEEEQNPSKHLNYLSSQI